MARARSLSSLPDARREAQDRASLGQAAPQIVAVLKAMFPDLTDNERLTAARDAILAGNAAAVLMNANRGQFGNPARLLGCDDPSMTVVVSMAVVATNRRNGQQKRYFVDAINLDRSGRLSGILDNAIAAILAQALGHGYDLAGPTSAQKSGQTRYSIISADCV
jgi:hypothetical protein